MCVCVMGMLCVCVCVYVYYGDGVCVCMCMYYGDAICVCVCVCVWWGYLVFGTMLVFEQVLQPMLKHQQQHSSL